MITDVLLVEDSAPLATIYVQYLKPEGLNVKHVATGQGALDALQADLPRVIILDVQLPDMSGLDILDYVVSNAMPCSVIIITAHGSIEMATQAMAKGAVDFLEKPFTAERLRTTVANVLNQQKLHSIVDSLEITERGTFAGFIGRSIAMKSIYQIIENASSSNASIFITGESGTGKEVCAEAVHNHSNRSDKNFVALNCAAIPKELIESEIFGHVKGAFTGAVSDRDGAARRAHGGTLFLDEIAEMDIDLQAKLLRFIQSGTIQKVGSNQTEQVDVRFVCATNRDPLGEVEAGRFREDLYYRLHVIPVELPPLRERDADVLEIATSFLQSFAKEEKKGFHGFDVDVADRFLTYNWPGNVRELQNVIRNIVVLNDGDLVQIGHLPPALKRDIRRPAHAASIASVQVAGNGALATVAEISPEIRPLSVVEREVVERAISMCDGNIPRAAALLEVSPSTIYRKRQAWKTDAA